ncbi:hypothetical protein L9F63_017771 [Diploptera punctata]|uniref:Uncharacterized protein n=1 Tax=Diploptera punctata TaxID=6984 RepID=A0AAD8EGP8_DIPPU|nr:hypothetical protein L9F63_017771 [Diploptera punctata]
MHSRVQLILLLLCAFGPSFCLADNSSPSVWIWAVVAVTVIIFLMKCCSWCAKQHYNRESPFTGVQRSPSRVAIIDSAAPQSRTCPQCVQEQSRMTVEEYLVTIEQQPPPPPYASLPPQRTADYNEEPPPLYSSLQFDSRSDTRSSCFVTQESGRS